MWACMRRERASEGEEIYTPPVVEVANQLNSEDPA